MSLEFELQPKQSAAFLSEADEILYGGAAGGGKSFLIRVALIAWCEAIAGLQCYLFRRTYPMLVKNHLRGPESFYVMLLERIQSGHVKIVKGEIRFWNGSVIYLCTAQHEDSVYDFQGAEIHVLVIDELTHFLESMYRFLLSRVRLVGLKDIPQEWRGKFPKILCGANPGGIGHVWVKKRFVTGRKPMEITQEPDEDGGFTRQYIPAKLSDNAKLTESDPSYRNRLLASGDPMIVRAMLDGDWNIASGSMFGETWREDLHTVEDFVIPSHWEIWRGADDGFSAPHAAYWLTQNPKTKGYFVIAEVYGAKMLPQEVAERTAETDKNILRWTSGKHFFKNTQKISGNLDSAAFSKDGTADSNAEDGEATARGIQINEALKKLGAGEYTPVEKWDGSVRHRIQNFHKMLGPNPNDPKEMPHLRFFKSCTNAIETIPAVVRSKRNVEILDPNADDHAFDGVTYALQWNPPYFAVVETRG